MPVRLMVPSAQGFRIHMGQNLALTALCLHMRTCGDGLQALASAPCRESFFLVLVASVRSEAGAQQQL